MPGRAQAVGGERVAQLAQRLLGRPPGDCASTTSGAEHVAAEARVLVATPRRGRPWFTCSAETR